MTQNAASQVKIPFEPSLEGLRGAMMLDYLGEKAAAKTIEDSVIELLRTQRLKGVNTGDHPTAEVGDLIVEAIRDRAAKVAQ